MRAPIPLTLWDWDFYNYFGASPTVRFNSVLRGIRGMKTEYLATHSVGGSTHPSGNANTGETVYLFRCLPLYEIELATPT